MLLSVLWISWKLVQGRPYFSYGHELNCLYACSVRPYGIMKVKKALVNFVYCITPHNRSCIRARDMFTFTQMPQVYLLCSHPIITVLCLQFAFYTGPFLASLHYEETRMKFHSTYSKGWRHIEIPTHNGGQCYTVSQRSGVSWCGYIQMAEDQKHCWGPSEHCNEILSCI